MVNKVTVVTSPTYHYVNVGVMLYDVAPDDIRLISETLIDAGEDITLFVADDLSEQEWILNIAKQVDYVVMNLENSDFIKGFILNSSNVMYYNSTKDLKQLNINKITSPLDFILGVIHDRS